MPDSDIDFHKVLQAIIRRYKIVLASTILCAGAAAIHLFTAKPVFSAKTLLLIEREGQNSVAKEGVVAESGNEDYYQTQYEILTSRTLMSLLVEDLRLASVPEFAGPDVPATVRGAIRISPIRRSRLVNVNAESQDPELAAKMANKLSELYIRQNLENRSYLSKEMLKALTDGDSRSSFESLPAVVNNPLIQELKIQEARFQSARAEFSTRYQAKHPSMLQIEGQLREVRAQIEREIRNTAESVKFQLSGQLSINNVRVIDPARVPDAPIRPRPRRGTALALIVGLAIGIVAACLVDQMDLTLRGPEDLEQTLKLPALGHVQKMVGADLSKPLGFASIWSDPRSSMAETFRNIRTAVNFRLANIREGSVLMTTSSIKGEGKSFVSANLARSFAQAGQRTLLIDGDMRCPTVHKLFSMRVEQGLSQFLAQGSSLEELVVESSFPNLSILACGAVPDNPAELLNDQNVQSLLSWATTRYERIIIDSPPVFPVADSLLWGKHVHGVIFVVHSGKTRAALTTRAVHQLKTSFSNVLGGILNQMSADGGGHGYYYGYYYGRYQAPKEAAEVTTTAG